MRRLQALRPILGFLLLACLVANAQDRRHVTEPVIPKSCIVLAAQLKTTPAGELAEADEQKADTARIQAAIDHCPAGQAVELKGTSTTNAFLSGPLYLREGVTVLVDKGAILFASRNPRDYDWQPSSCGVVNQAGHACKALINGEGIAHAAVMGEGVIDGRGGSKLMGQDVSWWDLAQEAKIKNQSQNCPRILVLNRCDDFTLYKITMKNSPNFHVSYGRGRGFTAWGVIINSPRTARNTDGIDPANTTDVTITQCFIHAGDDNVAIKAGGAGGPSAHISVVHNHFYAGHGMSIGSETDAGAYDIEVRDLTIDGADNGIRIKSNSSRGGLVQHVIYEDICIRDTKNPIFMDSNYSFYGVERNKLPTFRDILLRNVRISGKGKITLEGYHSAHQLGMTFDNVVVSPETAANVVAKYANLTFGPGPVNFHPTGPGVHITSQVHENEPAGSCVGRFVSMPHSQ